jgi:small subunit ribosomal protein S20
MPVTKTAKRALRASMRKRKINKVLTSKLEIAIRKAKVNKTKNSILAAISLSDKASKKKIIHKNKAARIKSSLTRLLPKPAANKTKPTKSNKKYPQK